MTLRSMLRPASALAALFVCVCAGRPAAADPAGTQDFALSWNGYGFTSPGNAFGPWTIVDFQYRATVTRGSIGLEAAGRNDADKASPQRGLNLVLDNYHDFSPSFYTYAAAGVGSAPYPKQTLYLEGDVKTLPSKALAFGLGGKVTTNDDGSVQHSLSTGPAYYWPRVTASYRYEPLWSSNGSFTNQHLAAFTFGEYTNNEVSLTAQTSVGTEANRVAGLLGAVQGQRAFAVEVRDKRWLTKRSGVIVGVNYSRVSDAVTGNLVFENRGLILGAFAHLGR